MSESPKPTPPNPSPKETTDPPPVNDSAAPPPKNRWPLDQSLVATVALSVISLCALIVSIYQTRVLSQQQVVMAEQQRIMTESAKAQLWPNVEISRYRAYDREGMSLKSLEFTIGNNGTGPAIIERATVQYKGEYAKSWGELFRLMKYPDTLSTVKDNASISGMVMSANTGSTFLGLSENQPLMDHIGRIIDNEGFTITLCYRSVFNDYWLREHKYGREGYDRLTRVDSCVIADSLAF